VDIVVSGGSDPDRPLPAPRARRSYLLELIALGVFLVAATTAYTGWTLHQTREDNRVLNCSFLSFGGDSGEVKYDDLEKYQQRIADQLDCEVPGR
jgi:hypothetical protein